MARSILVSPGSETLVDEWSFELASQFTWYVHPTKNVVYARRMWWEDGKQRSQGLHTLLTGWPKVDHRDGDGLNNQLFNLRPVTDAQNLQNARARSATSVYKGVGRHCDKWRARIYVSGIRLELGSFALEEEAALAYDRAAREYFGEFACFNFPGPGESAARRVRA
jgi:hypothetical protein